jgi:type IX secretion system PorP/SprF family membrane protein
VIGTSFASAQQDPHFSQYMFNKLFMNPAYAGIRQAACFSFIGRQQWAGFDGSPRSAVLSGDLVLPEDWSGGVGFTALYDKLGFEDNAQYTVSFSHHFYIPRNKNRTIFDILSVGIDAGVFSKRVGPEGSEQWVATTNWMNDQSIPGLLKKSTADFGFGLWYQSRKMFLGASSSHLTTQLINEGPQTLSNNVAHDRQYQMARHYFLTGGMVLNQLHTWEFHPSFLIKSDATITSFDLSCIALYQQKFWMGVEYRVQDAIIPMIGFQNPMSKIGRPDFFDGGMKIGFAYDYTLSNLKNYNSGTFELFANYCVPIVYKTTRWGDTRIFDKP